MTKTYSVAMGAVLRGQSANVKDSAILRGIIGNRCYNHFAGGQLEEVVDDGFVLSYLPNMEAVDNAVSALREAGVKGLLQVGEDSQEEDSCYCESKDIKVVPAVAEESGTP